MVYKNLKNGPQKLLIIGWNPSSPDHSPLPRIDFSYYQIWEPYICSLICVAAASFIKIVSLSLRDHLIIMSVGFGAFLNHLPKDDSDQLGLITIDLFFFQIDSLILWKSQYISHDFKWFITFVYFHKVQNDLIWKILIWDKKNPLWI